MNINEVKNGANSVAARPVPLFASSWIALYAFLRDSLLSDDKDAPREQSSCDHEDQSRD